MKKDSSGKAARAGVYALLGSLAGFAAGLLVAPEQGPRTRRRLLYQLENVALRTGMFVEGLFQRGDGSDARRTGDALVADAQERAQRIRDDIDALLEEMRRQSASEEETPSSAE